jgi:hypothetical protein
MKLKSICTTKERVLNRKDYSQNERKIFASYILDRGLLTRIFRELKKLNSLKINDPMKKESN